VIDDNNDDACGAVGGMRIGSGTEVPGENLRQGTLSTANPTLSDLGSNLGRRGGKLTTNRRSYGTAVCFDINRC
jgi:hypothetical protein